MRSIIRNRLSQMIFLLIISFFNMFSLCGFSVSDTYGKVIYPWNATTAIVKAGDYFDVWFIAELNQVVYSVVLNVPYNTVHIASASITSLSGSWQYDPVSENTYNTHITVAGPANTPEDRYDLILNTSKGEVVSKSSVKGIREYKTEYKMFLIADSHLGQRGTEVLVPNKHTAFVDMANIINPEIVVNAGDVVYYHSDPNQLQERMDLFYHGDKSRGWKGMNDFNAPTFVLAGNHDFQEGGIDGLPQEGYYDLKSDYWNTYHGLQFHFFSYGNSRYKLFNNGWNGYEWQWQFDRAKHYLNKDGSAANLKVAIAHISRTEHINSFAREVGLGLYLLGHNHHLGDRNPYLLDDRLIMYYARSVRDHFEFILIQIDNSKGTFMPLGYTNTDPDTDGYGLSTGNNKVLENDDEKNNPDLSVWKYNLTLDYEHENNGNFSRNTATLVNKFDYRIPNARVRFVMPGGVVYNVSQGTIFQAFDGNDYHIIDVDIDIDAMSTRVLEVAPKNFK